MKLKVSTTAANEKVGPLDITGAQAFNGRFIQISLGQQPLGSTVTGGTLTFKALASGAYASEDIIDPTTGSPIAPMDLSAPITFTIQNQNIDSLEVTAAGVTADLDYLILEVTTLR